MNRHPLTHLPRRISNRPVLKVGDRALYRGGFGGDPAKSCVITAVDRKDGQLVYDCRLANGEEHWGYADQFDRF